jgi:hypothetical protein
VEETGGEYGLTDDDAVDTDVENVWQSPEGMAVEAHPSGQQVLEVMVQSIA